LVLVGGTGQGNDSLGIAAIVFFAGYSWEWILQQFERVPGLSPSSRSAAAAAALKQAAPTASPTLAEPHGQTSRPQGKAAPSPTPPFVPQGLALASQGH